MENADIDLSEIPEVTRRQLADARLRFGLKSVPGGKTRVNMFLDRAIVQFFKMRAGGRGYQTLINESLVDYVRRQDLEEMLRRVIREEMKGKRRRARG